MSKKNQLPHTLIYEELEPRLLFSAGLEGVVLNDVQLDTDTAIVETVSDAESELLPTNSTQATNDSNQTREVVFIDENVDNYDQLMQDLTNRNDIDVYILDDQSNGIEQITRFLANYESLDAIHIISHGSEQGVQLGNNSLDTANLNQYSNAIESWQNSLSEDADLMLYGCDLAGGADGRALLTGLQNLTGADVAASDDVTGHASLGGDWDLEYQNGMIETNIAFSNTLQQQWQGTLAVTIDDANITLDENSSNGTSVTTVTATGETPGDFGKIYWVDKGLNKIMSSNTDGTGAIDVITGLDNPVDIAIDHDNGKIYWTTNDASETNSMVQRANLDGSGVENVVTGLANPDGITLDLSNDMIYWTDSTSDTIERANLDGSGVETIVNTGLNVAADITLDVDNGKMYWVDISNNTIEQANLDGTGRATLLSGLNQPVGIDIDVANNKMYWSELGGNGIFRANLDGSAKETVLTGAGGINYMQLDLAGGKVYWTEENLQMIQSANLDGTGVTNLVTTGINTLRGIDLANPGNTTSYSITDGNTGGAFTIDANTGEITVADSSLLNFEDNSTYTLTVQVQDTITSDISNATITINLNDVNEAPTSINNTVSTNEDTPYTFSAADFNFSDVDSGNTLNSVQITSLENVGALQLSGVDVTLNQVISKADIDAGLLSYTPVANANGTAYDAFTFSVNDGTTDSISSYSMTMDVTAVNDAPINSVPGEQTTPEDSTLIFSSASGNAISVTDVDANGNNIEVQLFVGKGTLSLNGTTGLSFSQGDGVDDQAVTFTGTVADINAALEGLAYTTDANANGQATLTMQTQDLGNTGAGGNKTDNDNITINVSGVNDAPTAIDNTVTTDEDTAYTFSATDFNFTDVDIDDSLNSIKISSLQSNGSLQLNGVDVTLNQVISKADIDNGLLTFTPVADANGTAYDAFAFTVNDGTTDSTSSYGMTIDVTSVNDVAVISGTPDSSITAETNYSFTPTTSDVDGDTLTYSISNKPDWATFNSSTGELSGTPTNSDTGTTTGIVISVSDGVETVSMASFDLTVSATSGSGTDDNAITNTPSDENRLTDIGLTLAGLDLGTIIHPASSDSDDAVSSNTLQESATDDSATTDTLETGSEVDAVANADIVLTVDDNQNVKFINQAQDRVLMPHLTAAQTVDKTSVNSFVGNDNDEDNQLLQASSPWAISQSPFNFELKMALEELNRSLGADGHAEENGNAVIVTTAAGVSIALTAGFVSWALKGSSLVAAFMTAMPTWNSFDPLPVISAANEAHAETDDETSEPHSRTESIFSW